MGLDMYLHKCKKVDGFEIKDYVEINRTVENQVNNDNDFLMLDLEKITKIPNSNELLASIAPRSEYFVWYSIFEEIGYWRKANQIHNWFVANVQDGVDECQLSIVPKEKIEELLQNCREIRKNKNKASSLLPTRSGFFFGNTEYDEWYDDDIKQTIKTLSNVLKKTDFDKEEVFYQASW